MSEASSEKIFSAITNFVKDLGDSFASESHSRSVRAAYCEDNRCT